MSNLENELLAHREYLAKSLADVRRHIDEIERLSRNSSIDQQSWYRIMVGEIHRHSQMANQLATRLAKLGVEAGQMSKRAAAEKLQMHPHTFDRKTR